MSTTIAIAAMGLVATLFSGWLGATLQGKNARDLQLLNARLRVYAECSASLYEYERATFNRVKARLEGKSDLVREEMRQEAYRFNAAARAAIGQLHVLAVHADTPNRFDVVRRGIGDFNSARSQADLKSRHDALYDELERLLTQARSELTG